jgi:molybdopterin-binding protein
MKLSVRNKLKGKIIAIEEGIITSSVKIDLGNGNQVISIISKEAISELNLKPGDEAFAVIKSTDVIVGIPCDCNHSNCKCH